MATPVPAYVLGQAAHLGLNHQKVCQTILRLRSRPGLDLLAVLATGGRLGYDDLLEQMRRLVDSGGRHDPGPVDAAALASVARASVGFPGPGGDMTATADLCRALRLLPIDDRAAASIDQEYIDRLDTQCNLALGRFDYLDSIADDLVDTRRVRWALATELAHPHRGRPGSTWDGWLAQFNTIFDGTDLLPIALEPGEGAPFDRIVTPPSAHVSDGPLVTVVVAVYEPDESFVASMRSIMRQTWRNLEVIVVDDCSSDAYLPLLEQTVALDERFTLHRMPVNGGPYRIRNHAMTLATGDLVTFQDADDWAHPQRIERQVRHLTEDPHLVAVYNSTARLFSDMSINKIGFDPVRLAISSLMFRRTEVLAALGSFDEVRKSGDSELDGRLTAVFGDDRVLKLPDVMTLYQLTEGSLSRNDFEPGWRHPERLVYTQAFQHWHSLIADGVESPYLEPGVRRFPAPPSHLGKNVPPRVVDVVVVADWGERSDRQQGFVDEVCALADGGLRVAVVTAETMRTVSAKRRPIAPEILQRHHEGTLFLETWERDLHAGVVIVRDPDLLSFPRPASTTRVRAERVVLHAPVPPRAPVGDWLAWDPRAVESHARDLFDCEPQWLPATAEIAAALAADGATAPVLAPAQLGVEAGEVPSAGPWPSRPVVGITDLDRRQRDRLSTDELFALLPRDTRFPVVVRDSGRALDTRTAPKPVPEQWERRDALTLQELVDGVDVLVCGPKHSLGPGLPVGATRALAGGRVVVAPRELEPFLGSGAVYLDGRPAADLLAEMSADPARVAAQQAAARAWFTDHFSVDALLTLVRDLAATGD